MSERHWPHPGPATSALATSALALMAAVAGTVSACGSAAIGTARPAGMTVATELNADTPSRLRAALLPEVDGARPVAPAEAGIYATLPDVQTSRQTMAGVTVQPPRCAQATMTAFGSPGFSAAPAAVVTFRVGRDGVSEVLVSAPPRLAETALGGLLPAGCDRYTATVDGETFGYRAKEVPLPGLAEQARALNVRATGYADVDIWSVVYRASGFVGAITMVGPDATEQGVKQLAIQAYATADRVLSGV
jgi:hypothetical protein